MLPQSKIYKRELGIVKNAQKNVVHKYGKMKESPFNYYLGR